MTLDDEPSPQPPDDPAPFQPEAVGQVVSLPRGAPSPLLAVRPGDELTAAGYSDSWPGYVMCGTTTGQSGWLPEGALLYVAPGVALVRSDYGPQLLNVKLDERLTLHEAAYGWYWASRAGGQAGWVLAAHVKVLDED